MSKRPLLLLGLATATFALQSCIDKNYDLNDIDKTIGTTADLTLPTSSTGDILLRNIMEEGEVVKFINDENGQKIYAVIQEGTADIQEINIPRIAVEPEIGDIEANIRLNELIGGGGAAPKKKVRVHVGIVDIELPDAEFHYEIRPEDNAKYTIQEAKAEVDPVVRGLEHVSTKEPVTASLSLYVENLPTMLNKIYLDNFALTIPTELEVSACTLNGQPVDVSNMVGGRIVLTGTDTAIELENGRSKRPLPLTLTMTGVKVDDKFKFTPNPDITRNGEVSITGDFEIEGSFRLNTADIDSDKLTTYLETVGASKLPEIIAQQSLLPLLEEEIHLWGDAGITPIVLGRVTGDILRDIADIEPIMLDDLPDFLNDPEVVLDLDNPVVFIKTSSTIPAVARTSLTLTSSYADAESKTVSVPSVDIPGSLSGQESRFCIADKAPTIYPTGYTADNTASLTKEGSVRELIVSIPKQVDVDIASVSMHIDDVDITQPYRVGVDYQVFAPLILGPNFKLVYSDTERDWAKDLDDVDDLDAKNIVLTADATSDLPAAIILEIVPIDKQARKITQLHINSVNISANAQRQKVTFSIEPESGHTLNDFLAGRNGMPQLDGIQYKATIASTGGGKLYESAKIRLGNIQITIKGGITYDAN